MMIAAPADGLRTRAEAIAAGVAARDGAQPAEVIATEATVGGGSLPGETLPSFGVAVVSGSAEALLAALRRGEPATIGRIEAGRVILDLRTVDPARDDALAAALAAALG